MVDAENAIKSTANNLMPKSRMKSSRSSKHSKSGDDS